MKEATEDEGDLSYCSCWPWRWSLFALALFTCFTLRSAASIALHAKASALLRALHQAVAEKPVLRISAATGGEQAATQLTAWHRDVHHLLTELLASLKGTEEEIKRAAAEDDTENQPPAASQS